MCNLLLQNGSRTILDKLFCETRALLHVHVAANVSLPRGEHRNVLLNNINMEVTKRTK